MKMQKDYMLEMDLRKKVEVELDKALKKLQEVEEIRCRNDAQKAMEEKKTAVWEIEKRSLLEMIHGQQELVNKCMEKIDAWEEK